ncbi:MAG: eL32 family ribosomal protein [Candidatus Nanoarchaeia archaeon]
MTDQLATRNKQKAKKPRFRRGQAGIMPQISKTWRRPRGIHNKIRRGKRGKPRGPALGFGSPASVKGLERNGTRSILVNTPEQLNLLKQGEAAIIASAVGLRKKIIIVQQAMDKKISILNVKDPTAFLNTVKERFSKKKQEKNVVKEEVKKENKKKENKPETTTETQQ